MVATRGTHYFMIGPFISQDFQLQFRDTYVHYTLHFTLQMVSTQSKVSLNSLEKATKYDNSTLGFTGSLLLLR